MAEAQGSLYRPSDLAWIGGITPHITGSKMQSEAVRFAVQVRVCYAFFNFLRKQTIRSVSKKPKCLCIEILR